MSALMTHQNKPEVSIVKGNVTTFRKKPIVPFARPTTAAINAGAYDFVRMFLLIAKTTSA